MVVGMMGGVGSGKSTVLNYLEKHYRAYVIKSDDVAKELMQKGQKLCKEVLAAFPEADNHGEIDSDRLAQIVFQNRDKLNTLNQITHPATIAEIIRRIKKSSAEIIVIESALMLGSGMEDICDELWLVYCDKMQRINRLRKFRGYSEEKAEHIIQNQPDDNSYNQFADEFIDNSYSVEKTIEQIDYIMAKANCNIDKS